MGQDLTTTSYALLGLLMFDGGTDSAGMTGYELKRRADNTLRFYWVSPAMSQVYTVLDALHRHGFVEAVDADTSDGRRARRFRITDDGKGALDHWLATADVDFPVLKHPVALRLMLGALTGAGAAHEMLAEYAAALVDRRKDLEQVRASLGERPEVRYPAMVADWGLAYYDSERDIVSDLLDRLHREA